MAKSGPIDPCDVKLKGCLFYETRSALVGEPFEVETPLAGLLLSDISNYLRNIFYYYIKNNPYLSNPALSTLLAVQ